MENEVTPGQATETTAVEDTTSKQETTSTVEDPSTKYAKYYSDTTKAEDPVVTGISSLKEEIAGLKAALASKGTSGEVTSQVDQTFLGLLREGKDREAEEYLVNKAAAKSSSIQEDLKKDFETRIAEVEKNIQERSQTDAEITSFVTSLRNQNPELADFEDIITLKAQQRLQGAINSGRIQTRHDMVEAFKGAVLMEVESAKQLIQRLRGAGKTEALTTKQTILSSSPARPNGVTTHGDKSSTEERKPMTTNDYLEMRKTNQNVNRRWQLAS
jgi:hypothetical protein